ncbi:hypothetical protein SAMN04487775_10364 [Treponema bryantii]|uniref:Uncharacterized protein n=1 Tax=Treponema bryantii TaxID=163 RepID=A0A1I3JIV5_9SPIR|nr:hypothetical protein [Treponema bryantii]SFI60212.1 hypothetical protein SAMN04487775_10364 [Treponema bryantii]
MAVIILHPTEELKLIKLQKEIISELFEEGRILYAVKPLWIKIHDNFAPVDSAQERKNELSKYNIRQVELDDIELSENSIFIPVTITTDTAAYNSKLTLVNLHSGRQFTSFERDKLNKIKQPVRQLKVFRLGNEKELGSSSKCITKSRWIKIK